jgi:predicted  nucleic acid-binding Zn-ribbon protein
MQLVEEQDLKESDIKALEQLSIKQKNIHEELLAMKEELTGIPNTQVKQFVKERITAKELNQLVYEFYDAFREVANNDPVKFEVMDLLAYIGITIYKEEDFKPYTDGDDDEESSE